MSAWGEALLAWAAIFSFFALWRIGSWLKKLTHQLQWTCEAIENENKTLDALRECRGENIQLRKELDAPSPKQGSE